MNGKRRTCRTCRWAWGHFWHVKATLRCYGSTLRGQCWHTKITLGYSGSILKSVRPKRGPKWSLKGVRNEALLKHLCEKLWKRNWKYTFYKAVRGEETASLERHSLTLVLRSWSKHLLKIYWRAFENIYLLSSCPWRGNRSARATLAIARAQELVEALRRCSYSGWSWP